MSDDQGLPIYTITSRPSDYPGLVVVRRHLIRDGAVVADADPLAVAPTLEEARRSLPADVFNVGRQAEDDPVILESWI